MAFAGIPWLESPLLALCGAVVLLALATLAARFRTSPSKKQKDLDNPLYQFPPSRRYVLSQSKPSEKTFESLLDVPATTLHKQALPTTRTPDLNRDNQFTPTGFSTQDIRALGSFPDYALLSGVRHPRPCSANFDITKAMFRPFRPFRWQYHQNMALMKFDPDYWVELEQNYPKTMAARHELLEKHADRIFFHDPGSELACRELMEMLLQFLCLRYPSYFSLERSNTLFVNRLLGTSTDLSAIDAGGLHPLRVIFDHVPEDYAIMLRNESDGRYYLRAAAVCSSVGWDVAQHRGKPLRSIHAEVPDYESRMAFSMDRYFSRMPADQPIQRCSWSVEDWAPLFASPNVLGDDAPSWKRSRFAADPAALTAADLRLRCDWQTLRRLPVSGAVVFNFKAVFTPLAELRQEPFVPALLLRVLTEGKANLVTYKSVEHTRLVAVGELEKWAREQVEAGIVPADWEVRTLDESPFYPGWEERWHAKQGF